MVAREIICATRNEWITQRRQGVTASEIPAILGISPWLSSFSLYWQKVTDYEPADNARMARGRRLERLIREDFQAAHRDLLTVMPTEGHSKTLEQRAAGDWPPYAVMYASDERPWQLCTPDALAFAMVFDPADESLILGAVSPVELKTAASRAGWGPSGSDQIPAYYRAQVLWQMDVFNADHGWVAVWIGLDDYREYLIPRDDEDLTVMRKAAEQFLRTVADRVPPPVDALASTTHVLKSIHAGPDDGEVINVPDEFAEQWRQARERVKQAKSEATLIENNLRAQMGTSRRAVDGYGRTVATRVTYERQGYHAQPTTIDRIYPSKDTA